MKLEPVIQSEVSQKEKHQYNILAYGIQKDGNDDPAWETAKETDIKNRLLDSVGCPRRGWGDLGEQY